MAKNCSYCGNPHNKKLQYINQAEKKGLPLYCNRTCAGLNRRNNKTNAENIEEKRLYDIEYRKKNLESLKKKKALSFKKDYDQNPEKYRQQRKKRYKKHLEYLQTPEYKAWKKEYDKKYHAKINYGEFWECAILILEIEEHIDKYEVNIDKGTYNKAQRRKRNQFY